MAGSLASLIGGLGGLANQATPQDVGVTQEQAMLAQYQQQQNLLGNLFPFGQTNTVMSTGATMRAGAANLGGAANLASQADVNAQQALAAQSPLQNLINSNNSNVAFDQGAQSKSGNTPSTTGNPPAA